MIDPPGKDAGSDDGWGDLLAGSPAVVTPSAAPTLGVTPSAPLIPGPPTPALSATPAAAPSVPEPKSAVDEKKVPDETEAQARGKAEAKPEAAAAETAEAKAEEKPEAQPATKPEEAAAEIAEAKAEDRPDEKVETKAEEEHEHKPEEKAAEKAQAKAEGDAEEKSAQKADGKPREKPQDAAEDKPAPAAAASIRPEPPRMGPSAGEEGGGKWVALVLAVAGLGGMYFLVGGEQKPSDSTNAVVAASDPEVPAKMAIRAKSPADPFKAEEPEPEVVAQGFGGTGGPAQEPGTAPSDPEPGDEPDPTPPAAEENQRVAPEGASPEAVAEFQRVPLSPEDAAPVSGIGLSGIHVDDISLGTAFSKKDQCTGGEQGFSVANRDTVNVCFRVVHQRIDDEEVTVLWQTDGGTRRRTRAKVSAKKHAYRTRVFLALRSEYVGAWTVKIVSADGVTLAQKSFNVVE